MMADRQTKIKQEREDREAPAELMSLAGLDLPPSSMFVGGAGTPAYWYTFLPSGPGVTRMLSRDANDGSSSK